MLGGWWKWYKTEGDFRPCNYMHYETASEACRVLSREARLCDSLASQNYDLIKLLSPDTYTLLSCSGSHMTETQLFCYSSSRRHGCAIVLSYGGPHGKGGGGDGR